MTAPGRLGPARSGVPGGGRARGADPSMPAWRPPRRPLWVLAVLAAHLTVLLAWRQAGGPLRPPQPTPSAESPALWWLWPAAPAPRDATAARPSPTDLAPRRPTRQADVHATAAISPPSAMPAPAATAPADALTAPASTLRPPAPEGDTAASPRADAPGTATLQLALPRRPAASAPPPASWATQDARVHRPLSAGERFAATLGTDLTLRTQALNDGGQRLQRGSGCVEVRPARESQINPFDRTAQALPRQVTGC